MKIIRKLISTYQLVKVNLPELRKELKDLTGISKQVIEKILEIWK